MTVVTSNDRKPKNVIV